MDEPIIVPIIDRLSIERVRHIARDLATQQQASSIDVEQIAIAVSELATNLLRYASDGTIRVQAVDGLKGRGIRIESRDRGPGISDIALALQDGFSTGGGLGSGLPGVVRLMDDVDISTDQNGTHITACKWLTNRS